MKEKPIFYPSFGNRPDQLVGRSELIDQLIEGLESYPGGPERAYFIAGQRGMGKTAMLLEVADQARKADYVVARVTCGETMLTDIIELLQVEGAQHVKTSKKPIKGFSAGALGFSVGLTFTDEARQAFGFRVKLEKICDRLNQNGKGVLILVDEVDPGIEQMRTLAKAYQELAGEEKNLALFSAGLPSAVSQTLNHRTLTFLNRAERVYVDPIPIVEVQAYYEDAFSRARRHLDSELVEQAAKATEGLPFLLQLLGHYIVKLTEEDARVTSAQLKRAEKLAKEELDTKVFDAMLNPLSDLDRRFLAVMAHNPELRSNSELEEKLEMTHGTFQTYRRRLLDAGVLASLQRGRLSFSIPLMADYLRRVD